MGEGILMGGGRGARLQAEPGRGEHIFYLSYFIELKYFKEFNCFLLYITD